LLEATAVLLLGQELLLLEGRVGVDVTFAGVRFSPGDWLYADADGIAISSEPMHD